MCREYNTILGIYSFRPAASLSKKIKQPCAVMKIYRASRVHVTEGHQMTDQTHNTAKKFPLQ